MWNKKMRLLSPFHKTQMLLHGINQQFPRGAFGIEHSYRHVAGAAPLLCKHRTEKGKQQNTKEQNGLHPSPFQRIPLELGFSGSLICQSRRQTTSSALQGPQGFPQSHVSH